MFSFFFVPLQRDWKNPPRIHLGMVLSVFFFVFFLGGGVVFFLFHVNHFVMFFFEKRSSEVRVLKTGGLDLSVWCAN